MILSPTTSFYTLSLHDALPILRARLVVALDARGDQIAVEQCLSVDGHTGLGGRVAGTQPRLGEDLFDLQDRKSTRLNSSHPSISYAVFCLKKKIKIIVLVSQDI